MKTKTQWKKQFDEALAALNKIESAEKAAKTAGLIGHCFRYLNSYGSGESWWLYARVIGMAEHGYPILFTFERPPDGEVRIKAKDHAMSLGSYTPISTQEYLAEWTDLQQHLAELWPEPASASKSSTQA